MVVSTVVLDKPMPFSYKQTENKVNPSRIWRGGDGIFKLGQPQAFGYLTIDQQFVPHWSYTHDSEVPRRDKRSPVINHLTGLSDVEAILTCFQNAWGRDKQLVERIVRRVTELQNLYYADEESQVSMASLKSMLVFLLILNDFDYPVIALNEEGLFHLSWRQDHTNLMTLRFKAGNFLDYVIFRPSQYMKKPIILNGRMNLFDFESYLHQLSLHIHLLRNHLK
jgi:hypothetical protein